VSSGRTGDIAKDPIASGETPAQHPGRVSGTHKGNYVQIEEGLTDAMAHDEARRCLRCDVCIGCGLCTAVCSEMGIDALRMADTTADRLAYFDFHAACGILHRLRCLHTGLPHRRHTHRRSRRDPKHDHHRNRGT
jgi:ferredoxin